MAKLGWKRLREDFLNPGVEANWARKGSIGERWGFFVEKGKDVYQWIEDWEDTDKNLVRYVLRYRTEKKNQVSITSETCDLDIVAIFMPGDVRQKTEEEAKQGGYRGQ